MPPICITLKSVSVCYVSSNSINAIIIYSESSRKYVDPLEQCAADKM